MKNRLKEDECINCHFRTKYVLAVDANQAIAVIAEENKQLKIADKLLFQVLLTINSCKYNERNLPDSFDDQLCNGINDYFKAT